MQKMISPPLKPPPPAYFKMFFPPQDFKISKLVPPPDAWGGKTLCRPPAKFVRGAPVLQLAPGRRVDTQAKPPEFSGGPRRETTKLRGPPE